MELSGGVKQGRRRDPILTGRKNYFGMLDLMSAAIGHDVLGAARDRTQHGPWWRFAASRLGDQTQAVALTTKGPNVSVLTHVEVSIGAPPVGDRC